MPGTPPAFAEEIVDRAVRVRPRPFRVREKVPWEEKNLIPIPRAATQGTGLFSGTWPLSVIFPIPPMHLDPCLLAAEMRKSQALWRARSCRAARYQYEYRYPSNPGTDW